MARIKPFKAVRPRRDLAHLVASRPVYTYKQNILTAKLEENPYTFIQIIHPEYAEADDAKTAPNSPERFEKVRLKFEEFVHDGVLMQDTEDTLYVYKQTKGEHEYLGVIAGASIAEYTVNKIKKHEATLTSREEMFTNYLDIVGFNAEPVLLCHEKNDLVDGLLTEITTYRSEYEFTTTDHVRHELWLVKGKQMEALGQAYDRLDSLYIADGHHRSASSARLHERIIERNGGTTGLENHAYFLSFLISEERMTILPFNRLVKTMNGLSKEEMLSRLSLNFDIAPLSAAAEPKQMHDIHLYMDKQWYRMRSKGHILHVQNAVSSIDAEILTRNVLSPILDIHDLKTDENIQFLSGESSAKGIEQAVNKGVYKMGFALYPVAIDQVKAVADENAIMPPKSTWVEPKLRSGLTIYKIDE
ncbi:MAG: DUF1015 domain-containing protein [Crocinitomicaceae bacterium]|nr:DUF1015 domain-containing protein [Crocinitomicaceae bacterium]